MGDDRNLERSMRKGGWRLVQESGLPTSALPVVYSIALADLDRAGLPEIIALSGGHYWEHHHR
jgi:hypothetical protein